MSRTLVCHLPGVCELEADLSPPNWKGRQRGKKAVGRGDREAETGEPVTDCNRYE